MSQEAAQHRCCDSLIKLAEGCENAVTRWLHQSIWESGRAPDDCKQALIVLMSGDESVPENHRGISLMSIAGKGVLNQA